MTPRKLYDYKGDYLGILFVPAKADNWLDSNTSPCTWAYALEERRRIGSLPGSQTCSGCGEIHREMKNLKERMMRCDCGNVMGRDQNAAVNHYWYPEERENRIGNDATRMEMGNQELAPVPVGEV